MVDTDTKEVRRGYEVLELAPGPRGLLEYFVRNPGRIISINEIVENIFQDYRTPPEELHGDINYAKAAIEAALADLKRSRPFEAAKRLNATLDILDGAINILNPDAGDHENGRVQAVVLRIRRALGKEIEYIDNVPGEGYIFNQPD